MIATGEQHSVRDFVDAAARGTRHRCIRWEGKGVDEKGYDAERRVHRRGRSALFPPGRSRDAAGRSGKAPAQARLAPRISFAELVAEMVRGGPGGARARGGRARDVRRRRRMPVSTSPATAAWSGRRWCSGRCEARGHARIVTAHPRGARPDRPAAVRAFFARTSPSTCSSPPPRSAASWPTTPSAPTSSARTSLIQTNVIDAALRGTATRRLASSARAASIRAMARSRSARRPADRAARADQPALRDGQDRRHRDVPTPTAGSTASTSSP